MKILKYLFVLAAIVTAFSLAEPWLQDYLPKRTPASAKTLGFSPNCKGKKYCVTVYVAPWCGVCKSTEPSFFAIRKFLPQLKPDAAFGVVIGAANTADNARMKNDLKGLDTYTDDSGEVMRAWRVNSFPTWIVTDAEGNEVSRRAGGFYASTAEEVSHVLSDFLKLQ